MTAKFLVRRNATEADVRNSPLGRVIAAADKSGEPIVYGDGYPAHNGNWWQPVSWDPAHVAVVGAREVLA